MHQSLQAKVKDIQWGQTFALAGVTTGLALVTLLATGGLTAEGAASSLYAQTATTTRVVGSAAVGTVGAHRSSSALGQNIVIDIEDELQSTTELTASVEPVDEDAQSAFVDATNAVSQSSVLLAVVAAGYGVKKAYSNDWRMAAVAGEGEKESEGMMPSPSERKKIIPLALMFFCILFNYTILRDTKDVLMVTAPKSGAEVIPFLKTYVNLPGAIAFTVIYSKMSNAMAQSQVFYTLLAVFLAFFFSFAFFLYPNIGYLHPHLLADSMAAALPASMAAPIAIFRNWTFSLFYLMAEMWGSVVVSILFWGLANQICTVKEAKKYYPLFGLGANVALIFSGQYVKIVSELRDNLPADVDPWGFSLKLLMGGIIASGAVLVSCYTYIQRSVITDPKCVDPNKEKASKVKTKLTMKESAQFLMNSTYIRDLALLVICYGMSINIVEVTWKAKLKAQFPDPNSYSAFMGNFSSATGTVTLVMMLLGRKIFEKFGWGVAASVTPVILGITGIIFFSLILIPGMWTPVTALLGTTPLMLAVLVGAVQNIMSKSSKYSLFDPCKEMAYIPLDAESRTKGKAAVDVIGNPLGKSGGSFIQQGLIFSLGSLAVSTPYLGAILGVIVLVWLYAARSLDKQFQVLNKEQAA